MAGMWLNNWRGMRNAWLLGTPVPGLSTVVDVNGRIIATTPSAVEPVFLEETEKNRSWGCAPGFCAMNLTSVQYGTAPSSGARGVPKNIIVVGTGNTPVTAQDYTLAQPDSRIVKASVTNVSYTYDVGTGTAVRTFMLNIRNNSAQEITVSEWGIVAGIATDSNTYEAMLYREVLDAPLTLAAYTGGTLNLTLTLTLDDPI